MLLRVLLYKKFWEIWWKMIPLFKKPLHSCNYVNQGVFHNYWKYEPSIHIKAVANSVWSELVEVYHAKPLPYMLPLEDYVKPDTWLLPKSSSWLSVPLLEEGGIGDTGIAASAIGLLHIRRGDKKDRCDTSIPEMEKFINCTFYGSNEYGKNITVLVGTDETDEEYLHSINQMLEKFHHIKAINFDKLVWNHLHEYAKHAKMPQLLNNFILFSTQNLIRPTLNFEIERHDSEGWSRCIDCESELLASHLKHENKFDEPRIYNEFY